MARNYDDYPPNEQLMRSAEILSYARKGCPHPTDHPHHTTEIWLVRVHREENIWNPGYVKRWTDNELLVEKARYHNIGLLTASLTHLVDVYDNISSKGNANTKTKFYTEFLAKFKEESQRIFRTCSGLTDIEYLETAINTVRDSLQRIVDLLHVFVERDVQRTFNFDKLQITQIYKALPEYKMLGQKLKHFLMKERFKGPNSDTILRTNLSVSFQDDELGIPLRAMGTNAEGNDGDEEREVKSRAKVKKHKPTGKYWKCVNFVVDEEQVANELLLSRIY